MENFESLFADKIRSTQSAADPAHDILHFQRVVRMAKKLSQIEGAQLEVVVPAAWLHDFINVPKNDPRRKIASRLSAEAALKFLTAISYPEKFFADIAHAIEAHSFSAGLEARTLEAKIVQDADRLDGLGAIGVARCFATAGLMGRAFYKIEDPFCNERQPDDTQFTVDHFYNKLFKTAATLQTTAGRAEGRERVVAMKQYLQQLECELGSDC